MQPVTAIILSLLALSAAGTVGLIAMHRRDGRRVSKAAAIALMCWFGAIAVASLVNGVVLVIGDLRHG